jgi:formylglycine-generating enzyme
VKGFVAVTTAVLAAFVACTAYDEEAAVDAPVRDAGADDASPADATLVDGGTDAPPGMVVVETAAARFAIDVREATIADWTAFRDTHSFATIRESLPLACAYKTALGPNTGGSCLVDEAAPTHPIHCIDWCDAHAYCTASGKRLCGKIGGGAVPHTALGDPSQAEWTRACAGGTNAERWSYGTTSRPGICNTAPHDAGKVVPTGSLAECTGGIAGLFDMTGNVSEWNDACEKANPADSDDLDQCATRGGSYVSTDEPRCNDRALTARRFEGRTIGVRCCKDL